jgi:hypothetical protein
MNALEFLRKECKSHNWDGIIHYGNHGEKKIDIKKLCEDYHKQKLTEH